MIEEATGIIDANDIGFTSPGTRRGDEALQRAAPVPEWWKKVRDLYGGAAGRDAARRSSVRPTAVGQCCRTHEKRLEFAYEYINSVEALYAPWRDRRRRKGDTATQLQQLEKAVESMHNVRPVPWASRRDDNSDPRRNRGDE